MSTKNIWSSSKIERLIELYKESKCLWNFHTEEYKNRKLREEAIENICKDLGITKQQYVKKIHNLRNQINFELRKRQKTEDGSIVYTGKWEFFGSLLFLTKFISYRVGNSDPLTASPVSTTKQDSTESDPNSIISADNSMYFTKTESVGEDIDYDEKHSSVQHIVMPASNEEVTTVDIEQEHDEYIEEIEEESPTKSVDCRVVKTRGQHAHQSPPPPEKRSRLSRSEETSSVGNRDECEIFGEFVANELRNLNSNLSRKKMKRRIMQAILEVGNEDDEVSNSVFS